MGTIRTLPPAVIVPVRDGRAYLERTLPPLRAALPPGAELLVCDDGSRDGSGDLARALGARVLRLETSAGPAAARNHAARATDCSPLVFLDADCRVHADTISRLLAALEDPSVTAAFGSYDDAPEGRSTVSLYKNLAHHFVHQRSQAEAATFWAGCGAIRRDAFAAVGGFDESYTRPSIEDVDLGYRLKAAGYRIRLVPGAQVTHLKEWTITSWLRADIRDRAIPWTRLLRAGHPLPRDLNFTLRDRVATALVALAPLLLLLALLAPWKAALIGAAAAALLVSAALDLPFLMFGARCVSPGFAVAAAGLHLLHRAAGLTGLAIALLRPAPAVRR
jgi:GT2 family glycosyltransferase